MSIFLIMLVVLNALFSHLLHAEIVMPQRHRTSIGSVEHLRSNTQAKIYRKHHHTSIGPVQHFRPSAQPKKHIKVAKVKHIRPSAQPKKLPEEDKFLENQFLDKEKPQAEELDISPKATEEFIESINTKSKKLNTDSEKKISQAPINIAQYHQIASFMLDNGRLFNLEWQITKTDTQRLALLFTLIQTIAKRYYNNMLPLEKVNDYNQQIYKILNALPDSSNRTYLEKILKHNYELMQLEASTKELNELLAHTQPKETVPLAPFNIQQYPAIASTLIGNTYFDKLWKNAKTTHDRAALLIILLRTLKHSYYAGSSNASYVRQRLSELQELLQKIPAFGRTKELERFAKKVDKLITLKENLKISS